MLKSSDILEWESQVGMGMVQQVWRKCYRCGNSNGNKATVWKLNGENVEAIRKLGGAVQVETKLPTGVGIKWKVWE